MIEFIIGKPGEGKTYYSVLQMLRGLINDERPIVTNVHLNGEHVTQWIVANSKYNLEEAAILYQQKIQVISDNDMKEFYCFRGPDKEKVRRDILNPALCRMEKGQLEPLPNFATVTNGVRYFLDEVHVAFSARSWGSAGFASLFYLSQHRKLNDDVTCITQHPDQVDKQFRMLCASYIVARNNYRRSFWIFAAPRNFRTLFFNEIPDKKVRYFSSETYQFTNDVSSCYDTMAGAGVVGGRTPTLKKAKGLPLWFFWVFVVGAFLGGLLLLKFSGKLASDAMLSGARKADKISREKVEELVKSRTTNFSTDDGKTEIVSNSPRREEKKQTLVVVMTAPREYHLETVSGSFVNMDGHSVSLSGKEALVDGEKTILIKKYE